MHAQWTPCLPSPFDTLQLGRPAAVQELILFSRADLERSIPCMVDGLKTGQRKILYCCFKRNLKKDIKASPQHTPQPLHVASLQKQNTMT